MPNNSPSERISVYGIEQDIHRITEILEQRLFEEFEYKSGLSSREPSLGAPSGIDPYFQFAESLGLGMKERLIIALALMPTMCPSALDILKATDGEKIPYTSFGGYLGQTHKGLMPTVETAIFLLSDGSTKERMELIRFFQSGHPLLAERWIRLEQSSPFEPFTASLILPSRDLIDVVTTGNLGVPEFGNSFPAERITTSRTWSDLVLPQETMAELNDILGWMRHEGTVMDSWGLRSKLAPGFRALFYGPPGTGKTLTATLLGSATGRHVYRIDLSMVVSKYIGETEKNLKNVFDTAQSRGWILFFDEADALFGKRTEVSDSKDRYANQEVSYLLQRVENFDGVVILASNNRENIDKAFARRFQAVIHFPLPSPQDRLRIWKSSIPRDCTLAPGLNLDLVAEKYELSGGGIMNVVRHIALRAAMNEAPVITQSAMLEGIGREYKKIGKMLI